MADEQVISLWRQCGISLKNRCRPVKDEETAVRTFNTRLRYAHFDDAHCERCNQRHTRFKS